MNSDAEITIRQWMRIARRRLAGDGRDPAIEASEILWAVLRMDADDIQEYSERVLSAEELAALEALVERREAGSPLQHLSGRAAFRYLDLEVGPGVFVPRPETEGLVDLVFAHLDERHRTGGGRVLELCAGSGAVLAALLSERTDLSGVGVEISELAAGYARRNLEAAGVAGRSELGVGDLYDGLPRDSGPSFDVIVANPPYIPDAQWEQLPRDVRDFEPRVALLGGADGADVIRRIVAGAAAHLAPGGLLALETDETHTDLVAALIHSAGGDSSGGNSFEAVEVKRDLAGRPRYVSGVRAKG